MRCSDAIENHAAMLGGILSENEECVKMRIGLTILIPRLFEYHVFRAVHLIPFSHTSVCEHARAIKFKAYAKAYDMAP